MADEPQEQQPSSGERRSHFHDVYAFISSSLGELKAERDALRVLQDGQIEPYFYDEERGSTAQSHQEAWRADLARCKFYIGIYWKKLGPYTLDEYEQAQQAGMPKLLYFKGPYESTDRLPELVEFIRERGDVDRQGDKYFEDPPEVFAERVAADLRILVNELLAKALEQTEVVHAGDKTLTETPHGGRADIAETAPPAISRREPSTLKPFTDGFVGRDDLVEEFVDLLEDEGDSELLALVGPKESGKEAVLQWLITPEFDGLDELTERYPHGLGVNPRGAKEDGFDDLLRTVFDAFFRSDDPTAVEHMSNQDILEYLEGRAAGGREPIRALLVFSDVPANGAFAELRKSLPPSLAVCATAAEEPDDAVVVPVEGLDDDDAVLELFAAGYKADVPDKATDNVLRACAFLDNLPGEVKKLARLAKTEAKPQDGLEPLVVWARAKAESPTGQILDRGGAARDAVKALLAAGGEAPVDVINDDRVAGAGSAGEAIAGGEIEQGSPRFRLATADTSDVAGASLDEGLMAAILESAVDWAESAWLDDIRDDRAFITRMVEWGAFHGRQADAIRLARAADSALAMGVRWGAWKRVLDGALEAALEIGDRSSEAWARHQLGTRALLLGHTEVAVYHLEKALEVRRDLGERDAGEVTKHNLGLLEPPVRHFGRLAGLTLAVISFLFLVSQCSPDPVGPVPFESFSLDWSVPVPSGGGMVHVDDVPVNVRQQFANPGDEPMIIDIAVISSEGSEGRFCFGLHSYLVDGEPRPDQHVNCPPPADLLSMPIRGSPLSPPPLVDGTPVAQPAQAEPDGCSIEKAQSGWRLTVASGVKCLPYFGFDAPLEPDLSFAATATFSIQGVGGWEGALTGSTYSVDEDDTFEITVTKEVDADNGDGFGDTESIPAGAATARYRVVVFANENVDLVRFTDTGFLEGGFRDEDTRELVSSTCSDDDLGPAFPGEAGVVFECRYDARVSGEAGQTAVNTFTMVFERAGVEGRVSDTATVVFTSDPPPPTRDVIVTKTVDANGDRDFDVSEEFPGRAPGPVDYHLSIRNRRNVAIDVVEIADMVGGVATDVRELPGSTCGTIKRIAPGRIVDCDFTAGVDPAGVEPHVNTVSVVVDPAGDSPYIASAEVTFPLATPEPMVIVTKTVAAELGGPPGVNLKLFVDSEDPPFEPLQPWFEVTVENVGEWPVRLVDLVDEVVGDAPVDLFGVPNCLPEVIEPGSEPYRCTYQGEIVGRPGTEHTDTVTATVVTVTDAASDQPDPVPFTSNVATVLAVYDPRADAGIEVRAASDDAFSSAAQVPEGREVEVEYRVRVEQIAAGSTTLNRVVVAVADVELDVCGQFSGLAVLSGAAVEPCVFPLGLGPGNVGDEVAAALDAELLNVRAAGPPAIVEFVNVDPALRMELDGPPVAAPGATVPITVKLFNTSVATTDPIDLAPLAIEPSAGVSGPTCDRNRLEPGDDAEPATCTFDLTVTTSGTIQPVTVVASGADDEDRPVQASAGVNIGVVIPQAPMIEIVKSLQRNADEDGSETVSQGDTLTYALFVLNIGPEPLTSVVVDDPLTGLSGTCGGASALAPGALASCTATHRVTAAEAANGRVVNEACVTAAGLSGPVGDCDEHAIAVPGLTLVKSITNDDDDRSGSVTVNDWLTYRYRVQATSTFASVEVTDPMPGLSQVTCRPLNGGPLSGAMQCSARYRVTTADAEAGFVMNTGRAEGTTADGQTVVATHMRSVDVESTSFTIRVVTNPPSGATFDFSGAVSARLSHLESVTRQVRPRDYVVLVTPPGNWEGPSISCSDTDSGGGTFEVAANENVTCTYRFTGVPVIDALTDVLEFDAAGTGQVTIKNIGTAAFTLNLVVSGPGFGYVDGCAGGRATLEPDETCTSIVSFQPAGPPFPKVGGVDLGAGVSGDRRVLLIGRGP